MDFDESNDFEILQFQFISVLDDHSQDINTSYQFLDNTGRSITDSAQLLDIKVSVITENDAQYEAEIWCVDDECLSTFAVCSKNFTDVSETLLQPAFRITDMDIVLCSRCSLILDPSLLTQEVEMLQVFRCDCQKLLDIGFADPSASIILDKERSKFSEQAIPRDEQPLYLHLKRILLNNAILAQQNSRNSRQFHGLESFRARVESGAKTVRVYENPEQQYSARQCIDFAKVHQYLTELKEAQQLQLQQAAETSTSSPPAAALRSDEELVVVALMRWFKCDHFKWCNKPKCATPACVELGSGMDGSGVTEPSATEREVGWAGRTELYTCNRCQQVTRFPRYNNPSHLLRHSPMGRCGEFANAFCLLCRSLGLDARYVLDFTDHVWVEVWIASLKRFVHTADVRRRLE